jgi:hypothetical protein
VRQIAGWDLTWKSENRQKQHRKVSSSIVSLLKLNKFWTALKKINQLLSFRQPKSKSIRPIGCTRYEDDCLNVR